MTQDGEHDWMDPEGGVQSIDNLRAAGNEDGKMYIVPRAGHHGALAVYTCFTFLLFFPLRPSTDHDCSYNAIYLVASSSPCSISRQREGREQAAHERTRLS